MNTSIFQKRLKELMNEQGVSQKTICEKTKIPKSAMSQYVNGYMLPKTDRLYLIAKLFKVNPVWLMGLDVPKEIDKCCESDNELDKDDTEILEHILTNNSTKDSWKKITDILKDKPSDFKVDFLSPLIQSLDSNELMYVQKYIDYLQAYQNLKRDNDYSKKEI